MGEFTLYSNLCVWGRGVHVFVWPLHGLGLHLPALCDLNVELCLCFCSVCPSVFVLIVLCGSGSSECCPLSECRCVCVCVCVYVCVCVCVWVFLCVGALYPGCAFCASLLCTWIVYVYCVVNRALCLLCARLVCPLRL